MGKADGFMHAFAHVNDLSKIRGGPGDCDPLLGVVLHVNVSELGTPDSFWEEGTDGNPYSVCPNFQVFKSPAEGGLHQLLPMPMRPWCQMDGNKSYMAVETAGLPGEKLTPFQVDMVARIMVRAHQWYGVPLQEANRPGQQGLGTHQMGGAAWGGHPCPGPRRARQRRDILNRARAVLAYESGHGR